MTCVHKQLPRYLYNIKRNKPTTLRPIYHYIHENTKYYKFWNYFLNKIIIFFNTTGGGDVVFTPVSIQLNYSEHSSAPLYPSSGAVQMCFFGTEDLGHLTLTVW